MAKKVLRKGDSVYVQARPLVEVAEALGKPEPPAESKWGGGFTPMRAIPCICVFLESGHTFTFKDVSEIVDNENVLQFSYKAMSDGRSKRVTFSKFRIVGHTFWNA